MNYSPLYWFVKIVAKVPLRTLLIVPFVLQTVGVATLVGYFSYRSGQRAIEKVADQLMTEVSDRVEQHLDSYLGKAQEINRINLDAFESGILDLNDFNSLGKYFYRQVRSLNFAYVNFGSKKGGFIGAGYGLGNQLRIAEIPLSDLSKIRAYSADNQGDRLKLIYTIKNPQTNQAAWYSDAVKAGKPIWSSIYTWGDLPDYISISASAPVYDQQKNLLGVLGIDLKLSQISQFLKTLHHGRSGKIFIIEQSGLIVASSGDESPAPIINGKATRLQALNSSEPIIRQVTQDLIQRFGSLQAISKPQLFHLSLSQKPFVRVTPYRDNYGLNWLVITVIPQSEFTSEIDDNIYRTFLICCLGLVISIGTGSFSAYWIAKPILRLSRASQAMTKGEWQESLSEDIAIAELKVLATSFNQMSTQIKKSFQESESKFLTIFNTTPDPVWIATLNAGRLLNVNQSFCQFWGDSQENIIGKTCIELGLWENLEDLHYFKKTLNHEGIILNFKAEIRIYSRQIKTVLISAKVEYLDEQNCVIGVMRDVSNIYEELRLRKQIEVQLRESQHFIEQITQLTPNLLYIYDHIAQKNIYMNRSVGELLGYSAAQIQEMGANLFAIICHPDDLHLVYETMERLYNLQDCEFVEIEYRVKDAQGQWRWLYSRDRVFSRNADGSVRQNLGTSQDVTDRKQAELELRKSRDLREAIYNESTDAIFLVDVPNPLIIDCNNRAVEMFEVTSKEELIGTEGQKLQKRQFTDDEITTIIDDIDKLGFWSQEIEYLTKTGRNFWGNLAVKRINIAGKIVDLVRVTDISERKEAELALIKSKKQLQKISASSPGVIYITVRRLDGSWYYEYITRAFEDIHEITVAEALENPNLCFEQFHPDDCAGYEEAINYSIKTMSLFNYEWRIITPSGKIKWIKARSSPEQRENGEVAFYGVVLDTTERKQVEEHLQQAEYNLRLANQELEKLVNTDGLTKIANRRCFDHHLKQEWNRLYREQKNLSLLLFDVDYFKNYNDFYGHQLGDECLIKIAQAVEQMVCRSTDLLARYGGEEFVVILPDTDIEGAIAVGDRIHLAVKKLAIPHQASKVSDIITISLGLAVLLPSSETSPADLINQADQALYRAKQQGRNQSVIF
ncbi:diguanylate cyclase [Cronbergia sp. UHCC 0137]|uniref:diguanylate cyclase domain-containing protein n=1 Tax=Cronbergia sp. UHCC 0137 TaxID=3110239 RepID=UPI002B20A3DB|nr:diguanylate cyclase [Cronbergia sp. UHCC 0137]MEA5620569.1 diguanylate cyclase [Cronbergia sp. UHCC 0137]